MGAPRWLSSPIRKFDATAVAATTRGRWLGDGLETGGFPGIPGAIQNVPETRVRRVVPRDKMYPTLNQVCVDPKPDPELEAAAVAAAEGATHVVLVLGLQAQEPCDSARAYHDGGNEFNPCGYEAEQHDRTHLTLPKANPCNLRAGGCEARGIPTAVVLIHGGSLAVEGLKPTPTPSWTRTTQARLPAHRPADALWGRFSPAGKLTYSVMPAAYADMSSFASMSMTDAPGRTYRYYPTSNNLPPPLWTFAGGLTPRGAFHSGPMSSRRCSAAGELDGPRDKYGKGHTTRSYKYSSCHCSHDLVPDSTPAAHRLPEGPRQGWWHHTSVVYCRETRARCFGRLKRSRSGNYTIVFTNEDATVNATLRLNKIRSLYAGQDAALVLLFYDYYLYKNDFFL